MIDRVHWIDKDKLAKFILDCQVSTLAGVSLALEKNAQIFLLTVLPSARIRRRVGFQIDQTTPSTSSTPISASQVRSVDPPLTPCVAGWIGRFWPGAGSSGLSLLEYPGVKAVDPAYALPVETVNRIFLERRSVPSSQWAWVDLGPPTGDENGYFRVILLLWMIFNLQCYARFLVIITMVFS